MIMVDNSNEVSCIVVSKPTRSLPVIGGQSLAFHQVALPLPLGREECMSLMSGLSK